MTDQEQLLITKYDLLFESRLSKVETHIDALNAHLGLMHNQTNDTCKEIKSDLRWMFGMFLGVSVMLCGLMAKGFHWFV